MVGAGGTINRVYLKGSAREQPRRYCELAPIRTQTQKVPAGLQPHPRL